MAIIAATISMAQRKLCKSMLSAMVKAVNTSDIMNAAMPNTKLLILANTGITLRNLVMGPLIAIRPMNISKKPTILNIQLMTRCSLSKMSTAWFLELASAKYLKSSLPFLVLYLVILPSSASPKSMPLSDDLSAL